MEVAPAVKNGGVPTGRVYPGTKTVSRHRHQERLPLPELNQSGAASPQLYFPARQRQGYGPRAMTATGTNSGVVPGVSCFRTPISATTDMTLTKGCRKEDPGLFGRVGYDVLDYKE